MKEIPIKKYIRYLFLFSVLLFVLNKFVFRPWILGNEFSAFVKILTYSLPNFVEAIIGTLLTTGLLLQFKNSLPKLIRDRNERFIRFIAAVIVFVYVVSQELKFHNLGGNNVYDPYDLIASVIGLTITFLIVEKFGSIYRTEQKPIQKPTTKFTKGEC